jgi:hypothetical protein
MTKQVLVSRLFQVAAIYGVIVLLPLYFTVDKMGHDYPPAITHVEFLYGFTGVALAWQVMFFIIARDPQRYRLAIVPGILEKLGWGVTVLLMFLQDRVPGTLMVFGAIDLALAASFAWAFWVTRESYDSPYARSR